MLSGWTKYCVDEVERNARQIQYIIDKLLHCYDTMYKMITKIKDIEKRVENIEKRMEQMDNETNDK